MARAISTNQESVHDNLFALVERHKNSAFKRPIAKHTQDAFDKALQFLHEHYSEVILDSCCGLGESTINLACKYPNAKIIGIDKSSSRLDKHSSLHLERQKNRQKIPQNYVLIQADVNDFWRLMSAHLEKTKPTWKIVKQYILYPNPYPKKMQVGKRWHGSPVFKDLLQICPVIEVRSNWDVYLQEFLYAATLYELRGDISAIDPKAFDYTAFERKYKAAGQTCFKLEVRPLGCDK